MYPYVPALNWFVLGLVEALDAVSIFKGYAPHRFLKHYCLDVGLNELGYPDVLQGFLYKLKLKITKNHVPFMGDFDNMSYEQAEMGLEELYIKYKCEAMSGYKRRKTHSFLFRNLEDGDCFLKAAVLRILIKIKRDIFSVDCDIFSLLESKDPRIRLIGRKLVKTFWSYYECDDAVVYAIHRHRMFYKMLKNNPKYKKIFSRRLTMWEEKVKTSKKLKKVEDHCRLESGSLYNALTEVNNCDELKQVLENYITKSSDNRKLILEYFIDKIIHYKSIESILIPGIGENETDGSKIDGEFKLELLGLKTRRLFKVIKGIYGRVTL